MHGEALLTMKKSIDFADCSLLRSYPHPPPGLPVVASGRFAIAPSTDRQARGGVGDRRSTTYIFKRYTPWPSHAALARPIGLAAAFKNSQSAKSKEKRPPPGDFCLRKRNRLLLNLALTDELAGTKSAAAPNTYALGGKIDTEPIKATRPRRPRVKPYRLRSSLRPKRVTRGARSARCKASALEWTPSQAQENLKMTERIDAIRKRFAVETAPRQPDKWLISCDHCGAQWHLKKDSTHPGDFLHLLNHAHGHEKDQEK